MGDFAGLSLKRKNIPIRYSYKIAATFLLKPQDEAPQGKGRDGKGREGEGRGKNSLEPEVPCLRSAQPLDP